MDSETKYLIDCYGTPSDTPMHYMEKDGVVITVITRELMAMIEHGWKKIEAPQTK